MRYLILYITAFLLAACTTSVPTDYAETDRQPSIYPEYTDVTIPCNIAPLHFRIEEEADAYLTQLTTPAGEWVTQGRNVCPGLRRWRNMLAAAKGKAIRVDVFTRKGERWQHYRAFNLHVADEPIDPYLSYRLIAPSYVTYEDLVISQRDLTSFDEQVIFGNMIVSNEKDGQCINCHSYQNYNPDRMQFHGRQAYGGTLVAFDGTLMKVNLKTDSTLSSGVYPAWHPTEKLIAYSTNDTGQSFHTRDLQKVEVEDTQSDLILWDMEHNEVYTVAQDSCELECFPWWSPDGKYLYYCSAHYEKQDTVALEYDMILHYKDIKYSLYRKRFDAQTRSFGPRETVFDAAAQGKSATLPRLSPDGRYLLFTLGEYGVFHIWHKDADLYLTDLQSGQTRPLDEINSDDVESYHSWSSNGRWIVFSSRRNDGNFTRPFFAYIDKQGRARKPFELPQEDPEKHREFLRSYNIPEFMSGPVKISPQELAAAMKGEACPARYAGRK